MNFTPQQLAGGVRYSSTTRVGNWLEDVTLAQCKQADFARARQQGTLVMGQFNLKRSLCGQAVPHTFRETGELRFGDSVVLAHRETGGCLAADPFAKAGVEEGEFKVAVCEGREAVARTVFVIGRCDEDDFENPNPDSDDSDDVVRYGRPFQLLCNPALRFDANTDSTLPPLYLASSLKSERKASPMSNQQLVFLSQRRSYDTVWTAAAPVKDKAGGSRRLLDEGEPVMAGSEIVLTHKATRQLLASDTRYAEPGDFGAEFEVCGKTHTSMGRASVMGGEFSGASTGQTYAKPEQVQNVWAFCLAAEPTHGGDLNDLPPMLDAAKLLAIVRRDVERATGEPPLKALAGGFDKIDANGDGRVDREDLQWCLRDLGVKLTDDQFGILLDPFDPSGDGIVSLGEFHKAARGPIEEEPVEDP